jgi:hypothetical protein
MMGGVQSTAPGRSRDRDGSRRLRRRRVPLGLACSALAVSAALLGPRAAADGHPKDADVPLTVRDAVVSRIGLGGPAERVVVEPGAMLRSIVRAFDLTPRLGDRVACDVVLADPPRLAFPPTRSTAAIVAVLPGCGRIELRVGGRPAPALTDDEGSRSGGLARLLGEVLGPRTGGA